ncbi:MAG TPA: YggT family protein [Herbaspirillum sp.]|uniref:YggT family protein n=1 Tax=Herbaspirillum sp. TaxID=1890675 RepID=UPI002D71395C|nr:YggT family protein [Herbaspirillum sp.]HZG22823.1 YggT family protein [Herbaspirillum sp.]
MLHSIFTMIVNAVASILAGVMLLRFWMQVVRVRPPQSVGQFVYQLSDWLVRPLRRVMPGGRHDWASLLAAFIIVLLSVIAILGLPTGFDFKLILLVAVERLFEWICYGFMATLIIEAIFSWVNPYAPLAPFVRALNEPLLRPLRRIIPPLGGVDLSPLVLLILLQIAVRVVSGLLFGAV